MTKIQLKSENVTRENEEMMEEDGPLSSSEAQRAPALASEEGLSAHRCLKA